MTASTPNPPPKPKPMRRADWTNTPYAGSTAKDPDKSIGDLLSKYGVVHKSQTETLGPNGRALYQLRFILRDRVYRVEREVLHVEGVPPEQLMRQVKRSIYFELKTVLEIAVVWGPMESAMLQFLEVNGTTVYEGMKEGLGRLPKATAATLALPPATRATSETNRTD